MTDCIGKQDCLEGPGCDARHGGDKVCFVPFEDTPDEKWVRVKADEMRDEPKGTFIDDVEPVKPWAKKETP